MNIPDYRVEPADFHVDSNDLRAIRKTVFIEEQNIPAELEWDDHDWHSYHFIARDAKHQPIGTGRLTADGRIGRVAVLPQWRNQGVGKALMVSLIDRARKQSWSMVAVHAQLAVLSFYQKFGFIQEGEIFMEAGLPHQAMSLQLEPLGAPVRSLVRQRRSKVDPVQFGSIEDTLAASLTIISEARRRLCIYSRDLEFNLYGQQEVIKALREFALQRRDGCVQIIVQDTAALRKQPHPLLELAQRLTSSFQFRMPVEPEDLQYPSAFLINDSDGYLYRQFGHRYQGNWSLAYPGRNRQLSDEFERFWQRFQPCTEFRSLTL